MTQKDPIQTALDGAAIALAARLFVARVNEPTTPRQQTISGRAKDCLTDAEIFVDEAVKRFGRYGAILALMPPEVVRAMEAAADQAARKDS